MARILDIEKIKEEDGIHYYFVSNFDITPPCEFYIGISPQKRTVSFFKTKDFSQPLGMVDHNGPEKSPNIPGLDKSAVLRASAQAYLALLNNSFPKHMGRYS